MILPARFSELSKAWSLLAYSTGSSCTYSSPGSTQSKNTSKGTTINHVQCTSNMMQYMSWYARCDMQCICVLRKEKWWTRHQLGKPSMPLERWDDFGWNRYRDHRIQMPGLQKTSKTRYDANCLKQQHGHLDAKYKLAIAPKHMNRMHSSDVQEMLYETWTLSSIYKPLEHD